MQISYRDRRHLSFDPWRSAERNVLANTKDSLQTYMAQRELRFSQDPYTIIAYINTMPQAQYCSPYPCMAARVVLVCLAMAAKHEF
jgi:hypothetical protein